MTGETAAFWSGHANSSAMCLRMKKIRSAPDYIVHAHTGREFEQVYEFMEKFEKVVDIPIVYEDVIAIKPQYAFLAFFNTPWCKGRHEGEIHGFPKSCSGCWHNRNVKQPIFAYYEKKCRETYTGFTVQERHRILAGHPDKKYPLIEWQWTAKDSLDYLKKQGIPHTIYDLGFERLGCDLCPKQNDRALKIIFEHFPDLWEELLTLEEKSPHGFRDPNTKKSLEELQRIWEKKPNSEFIDRRCSK